MDQILIWGGDERSLALRELLRRRGYSVVSRGLDEEDADPAAQYRLVVLPVPSFLGKPARLKVIVGEAPTLEEVAASLAPGVRVAGYFMGDQWERWLACVPARRCFDMAQDEGYLVDNAELTAEGAVALAASSGGRGLWGSHCLVMGYGRIGKALVARLLSMRAQVLVTARRAEQRSEIADTGALPCDYPELHGFLPQQDFVFNTVPTPILGVEELMRLPEHTRLYELSSLPYGIDLTAAHALGLWVQDYPGLPGKMYAQTSALILYKSLRPLLQDR